MITDELKDRGKRYNRKRIANLLVLQGLYAKAARWFKKANTKKIWPHGDTDLVKQEFTTQTVITVWSSVITYLWTREELEMAIIDYIECFYNKQRKHSALGYLSLEQYEQHLVSETKA